MSEVPKRIWRWWDERPKDAPRLVVVYSAAGEPYPEGAIPYTRDDIVADRIAEAVAKERKRVARTVGDFMMQEFGWVDGIERIVHDMLTAIRQTEGEG